MKKDSLGYFGCPKDFLQFVDSLDIYNGWRITKGLMNARGEVIRHKSYANQLRKMFSTKKAFRREVSISEIVSWLDSFVIMTRVVNVLRETVSNEEYNNIKIYFEYIIKMSKKMRVDFVIEYENTLLILELRMIDNFRKIRATWAKKKGELLIYKELMQNYIEDKRMLTYALVTLYEYDGRNEDIAHTNYNNNQAEYLAEYIRKFIIKR